MTIGSRMWRGAVCLAALGACAPIVLASPNGVSIGIKFASEEPAVGGAAYDSVVDGAAGVLQTEIWNNMEGAIGGPDTVKADVSGEETDTNTTVEWISNNTWSSDGRTGEVNNLAPEGNDRNLMLGYLDTNAVDPGFVTVDGLDSAFTDNGYDVYVYAVGGVVARGGDYTIGDTTYEHTVLEPFDGEWIEGEEGNYMVFRDLTESGFELEFQPQNRGNGTFRAVVNAIEIVAKSASVPGDFNGDGLLTTVDIDDLTGQSAAGTHPVAYDLNTDALVNEGDVNVWVKDLFNSWIGDADLNGEFNSSDLVTVLASGTYEADVAAVWSTGDFNGDGRANSSDLVAALADGGYEQGPRAAVAAVPEPTGIVTAIVALLAAIGWFRRIGCR
jgi:hypothetical protein